MSGEFYDRVARARLEFAKRMIDPDHLYLGRQEYMQLKQQAKELMMYPLEGHATTYMGLRIFLVNESSHFAVAKVQE